MKKVFTTMCLILGLGVLAYAQQYRGISSSIKSNVDAKGKVSYSVSFINTIVEQQNVIWYLSYKGKRVSDYFNTLVGGRHVKLTETGGIGAANGGASQTVFAWPGEVPKEHEMYVTVQLGKEPEKKDRRDND